MGEITLRIYRPTDEEREKFLKALANLDPLREPAFGRRWFVVSMTTSIEPHGPHIDVKLRAVVDELQAFPASTQQSEVTVVDLLTWMGKAGNSRTWEQTASDINKALGAMREEG